MWKFLLSLLLLCWLSCGQAAYLIYDFAGNGKTGFKGDDGPATEAELNTTRGLAIDKAGNVFFADVENRRVRRVDIKTKKITTVTGCGKPEDNICERWWNNEQKGNNKQKALETQLSTPIDVAIDTEDNLYILDHSDSRVYKVDSGGYIFPVVNKNGNHDYSGDGGLAIEASINPNFGGITIDQRNNDLYIADRFNNVIRKVDAKTKIITTVAGTGGKAGYETDKKAIEAKLNLPEDILIDANGIMYIADSYNHVIRKVDTNGNITTIAGIPEQRGYNGDDKLATEALFNLPIGIAIDNDDNLYIADHRNHRIRKLTKTIDGYIISTIAGNGKASFKSIDGSNSIYKSYDGEFATRVSLHDPEDVALTFNQDNTINTIYIADHHHYRIRKLKWTDKEPPNIPLIVTSIITILIIFFSILYYFRWYTHPDVKNLSANPTELLNLSIEQLAGIKRLLKYTGNLKTVLAKNSIPETWLNKAIKFIAKRTSNSKRCELLAERLLATFGPVENNIFRLKISQEVPLNLPDFLVYFPPTNLPVKDIANQLRLDKMQLGYVIVISLELNQRLELIHKCEQDSANQLIVPSNKELLQLFLLPPNGIKVFASLVRKSLKVIKISPYQTRGGVTKDSLFFGRRTILRQIIYSEPKNYLLTGGRGIGKTSILKKIKRYYPDKHPEVNCLFFSLNNDFLLSLNHKLKLPKDDTLFEALTTLVDKSNGKRCLILLDEADLLIKQEAAYGYNKLKTLREFSEVGGCKFILAGFWELYKYSTDDYQSPILNFAEPIKLGGLEADACEELITKPMNLLGIDCSKFAEEIITITGSRANLVATICEQIVKNAPEDGKITNIQQALQSLEVRGALASWRNLTDDEEQSRLDRIIVYSTIEQDKFSRDDLDLKQYSPDLVSDSLLRLEIAFIIKLIGKNRYDYCVPLFREMLLEQDVKALLEQELKFSKSGKS